MSKYICQLERHDAVRACPTVDGPIWNKLLLVSSKLCMWEAIETGWSNCAYTARFYSHTAMNQIKTAVEE